MAHPDLERHPAQKQTGQENLPGLICSSVYIHPDFNDGRVGISDLAFANGPRDRRSSERSPPPFV